MEALRTSMLQDQMGRDKVHRQGMTDREEERLPREGEIGSVKSKEPKKWKRGRMIEEIVIG